MSAMRPVPLKRGEPSLEERLSELDAQLRTFEATLRAQQQSHNRIRNLELELAAVVERGASSVRELAAIRDEIRLDAQSVAREAATPAAEQLKSFEERGQRLLDAYAEAVRAAHQAVARAEARIEAFDERVGRELAEAGKQIHQAAQSLREGLLAQPVRTEAARTPTVLPVLLAAALLVPAAGAFFWMTRALLREASARADSAERQIADVRRDASQQIASIQRKADEVGTSANEAGRLSAISAAPDLRRLPMRDYTQTFEAAGQALWSPSQGLAIVASRLPALPDGEVYQVWVVTGVDVVSLGTITPDRSGRLTGVFDLPAGLRQVRGFMITRERVPGALRPSAAVVLAT
jgi:hypothetical protein